MGREDRGPALIELLSQLHLPGRGGGLEPLQLGDLVDQPGFVVGGGKIHDLQAQHGHVRTRLGEASRTLLRRGFVNHVFDPRRDHRQTIASEHCPDEVIAHLVASGASVQVRIEIEAEHPTGFDDAKVRTVSENAATLKFSQSGFEET